MSSSSESIPLAKMAISPRQSASLDQEERDTLLMHPETARSARTGAIWQILAFTAVGLVIALASAAFAYTLRTHNSQSSNEFVHVALPDMSDPSLLKYFGGMGPYIGAEYNAPPSQCRISQVHMMARHGERYPTNHMGANIAAFAKNVSSAGKNNFIDTLEFLNTWTLTSPDNWLNTPEMQLEQETLTGPAAGSTHMFTLGSEFRSRYGDLWDFSSAHHGDGGVKVWSSDSVRVIHSAKYFASAFFGVDVPTQMEVIPETEARWGNSLTTTYFPRIH
jgi:acid phosphatase